MTEDQARRAAVVLLAAMVAGYLAFTLAGYRLLRQVADAQRAALLHLRGNSDELVSRQDLAMWQAEVTAAEDAPGEGLS